MSNGALPKAQTARPSTQSQPGVSNEGGSGSGSGRVRVQNSSSEFAFELKPKPKLTCIPENSCGKFFSEIRKTQSMNAPKKTETAEKSWSVLFIGSMGNVQMKSMIM